MEFYDFPYIGNFIIPSDKLIFFRGVGIPPTRYIYIYMYIRMYIYIYYSVEGYLHLSIPFSHLFYPRVSHPTYLCSICSVLFYQISSSLV